MEAEAEVAVEAEVEVEMEVEVEVWLPTYATPCRTPSAPTGIGCHRWVGRCVVGTGSGNAGSFQIALRGSSVIERIVKSSGEKMIRVQRRTYASRWPGTLAEN